jgi:hypothetical protein
MPKATQPIRTVAIAIAIASLGTGTAFARPADMPSGTPHLAAAHQWTLPRVESMGVRPADPIAAAAPATPAVPLTHADNTGGFDLLSVAVGACAVLALLLLAAAVRYGWPRVRPIRARQA